MKRIFPVLIVLLTVAASAISAQRGGDLVVFDEVSRASYAGFLFDHTPDIERVDVIPARPLAGQRVKIGAKVVQDLMKSSLPVKKVDLFYSTGEGKEWEEARMIRSDGDADYYFAYIPPQPTGTTVRYYLKATDFAGSVTVEAPGDGRLVGVVDDDDEDKTVLPDIDVLKLEVGYDEKYVFVKLTIDGKPGRGDMAGDGAYIYFIPVIDVSGGKGLENLFTTPVLAYAPILSNYLNVPATGLYRISDLLKTKKQIEGADVRFKKRAHTLSFRVNRDVISESKGDAVGFAALTTAVKSPESLLPWEATPYITLLMRSHEYVVEAEPEKVKFMAGAAQKDITPPIGTPLAGYGDRQGAPSEGVHDPLMVQALVIQAGTDKMAFVTADFLYMRRKLYNDVSVAIEEATGITRGKLFISASHSHSSAGGTFPELALLGGPVRPGLYDETKQKFIDAIIEANGNLQPARIGTGSKAIEGMNVNRREKGGPVDPELSVLRADDADGKPIAFYYNFAAHPTVMGGSNLLYSAEFPGSTRASLVKKYPGAIILFANGSLGNMSVACPGDCGSGFEKIDKIGEIISGHILEISDSIEMKESAEFTLVSMEVLMHPGYDTWSNMSAMRIGDAAFITNPGELYVELGFPVRKKVKEGGLETCFMLGITNDGIGYIIPEDWYHKHVYEATFAFYGPSEGEFIRDVALDLAGQISGAATNR